MILSPISNIQQRAMVIIDAHTHIFPENLASKILESIAKKFNVNIYGKGTPEDLLRQMDENGILYAVICMVSPYPSGVKETNTWIINLKEHRFIKFGTIHPHYTEYKREIQRLRDNCIEGVKFQPDVQGFTVDDKTLTYPLYEEIARHNLKVMFHVGGNPEPGRQNRSRPEMIAKVAGDFPELQIIAGHLGGLHMWDTVNEKLAGIKNVFMETSLTYKNILPTLADRIIRKHGVSKIFFGTDYPFASVRESIERARDVMFLSKGEKEAIFGTNALNFFQTYPKCKQ